jgi:adenosylhomocysteine nucleosidase
MVDIAIFTALAWERRAVTRGLAGIVTGDGPRVWRARLGDGASCLVVQTGIGPERARLAASGAPPARLFLACGCGGALVTWLRPGDLVAADGVVSLEAHARPTAVAATGGPLAAWAAAQGFRLHRGPIVSSAVVLGTAAEKAAAGRSGALLVDMESAAVATVAQARGIPFVGLRVVLDAAAETLPDTFSAIDETTGELRVRRAVAGLAVRPWRWVGAARLARQQRVAARRLGAFLSRLLDGGGLTALLGSPLEVRAAAR